jgi:hypothetical protein
MLAGGGDRPLKALPLGAGDHLVLPCFKERLGRGQQVGLAGRVEFVGDRQQELNEVVQIDLRRPLSVVEPLLRDGGRRANGVCDRLHGGLLLADGELATVASVGLALAPRGELRNVCPPGCPGRCTAQLARTRVCPSRR